MFLPGQSHDTVFIIPGVLILRFEVYVSSSPPSSSVYHTKRVVWFQLKSRDLQLVVSCYFFSPGWSSVQFCYLRKMKWKLIATLLTWLLVFLQGSCPVQWKWVFWISSPGLSRPLVASPSTQCKEVELMCRFSWDQSSDSGGWCLSLVPFTLLS